jgi:DNA-binding FadR family transcriptional regulator
MVSRAETNNPGLRYVSIADTLQKQIESGEVRYGDRFPSQNEMAKQYGISLTTLRSAVELLKAVDKQDKKTPVVLVTGAGDTDLINEAMDHGPVTLIRKPLRVKQVRQVLEVLGVQNQVKA